MTEESIDAGKAEEFLEADRAEESVKALSRDAIKRALRDGFRDVGRSDLADMVSTADFSVWVNRESGWDPTAVSGRTNQGKVNGGLFQFWYGHHWAQRYFSRGNDPRGVFTMTPHGQAEAVVHHFPHVSNDLIRKWTDQIRNGTYQGWG